MGKNETENVEVRCVIQLRLAGHSCSKILLIICYQSISKLSFLASRRGLHRFSLASSATSSPRLFLEKNISYSRARSSTSKSLRPKSDTNSSQNVGIKVFPKLDLSNGSKTSNGPSKAPQTKYAETVELVRSALKKDDPEAALSAIQLFYENRNKVILKEKEKSLAKDARKNKGEDLDLEVDSVPKEPAEPRLYPTLYNRVISYYSEKRNVDGAVKVLNIAKANPLVALDAFTYAGVIAACARAGQLMPAYRFFQEMLRSRIQPDIVIFNTLLRACGSDAIIAQKLWKSMVESKIRPDDVSYSSLINSFAEAKLFNKARLAYREMVEAKLKPTAFTFAALIRAAGLAKDWRRAFDYISESKASGVEPNLSLHRSIMLVYATLRDSQRAKTYFESIFDSFRRDEAIVASLIKAHVGVAQSEQVRSLWEDLQGKGFPLSSTSYASAIYAFCELGDLNSAWNLLAETRSRKVTIGPDIFLGFLVAFAKGHQVHSSLRVLDLMIKDGVTLTSRHYNAALQACKSYDTEVENVLTHMRGHGVKLDVVGYNILINLAAQSEGGKEKALRLYYSLRQDELHPDIITFNTLIKACGESGDVHEVARLVGEMDELKVRANVLTYRSILKAYKTDGERALQTLRKMRRIGLEADVSCYVYTMHALRISSRHSDAVALYEELIDAGREPFAEVFGISVLSSMALGDIEKAFGTVQTMKKCGLAPTERIAAILLEGSAVPNGDTTLVERVLDFVKGEGIPFGETLYDALLEFYAGREDKIRVLEIFDEMRSKDLRRSWRTWRALLRGLEGDPVQIANHYPSMMEDRVRLNPYACNLVVDALLHVGNVSEAHAVYERCLKEGIKPNRHTVTRLLKAHESLAPPKKPKPEAQEAEKVIVL